MGHFNEGDLWKSYRRLVQRLELILEENKLLAATSVKELLDDSIQLESFGNIYLQANGHNQEKHEDLSIEFRNVEIISLDTISPM